MIFDNYTAEEADAIISKMQASNGNFSKFLKAKDVDELISITKARAKAKKKTAYKNLFFTEDDLRFATPDIVAEYRAGRLKCNTLVDIGCSVGLQTFAFARHCNKVIAIEIDERKILYAKENAKRLGIKNIEFIHGDALNHEIIKMINGVDIVFSDTERLPEEKTRSLDRINPNIGEVLRKYGHLTEDFCFEIPASIGYVDISGEMEYIDIDKKLNRLNLYRGSLQNADTAVVSLPSGHKLEGKQNYNFEISSPLDNYVGVVSAAVAKAGLVSKLLNKDGAAIYTPAKIFLVTAKEPAPSEFIDWFLVLGVAENETELKEKLRAEAAGKVILRFSIEDKEYWDERMKLQKDLNGQDTVYLFKKEKYILAKKV